MNKRLRLALSVLAVALAFSAAACSSSGNSASSSKSATTAGEDVAIHNMLPADIKSSGVLTSAYAGNYPPWASLSKSNNTFSGAMVDFSNALGAVLGVQIKTEPTATITSELTGLLASHYDLIVGPVADIKSREQNVEFIDFTKQESAFLVPNGNPNTITGITSICGLKIAVQAGSWATTTAQTASANCAKTGKKAASIQVYSDQTTAILALQSGRVNAVFAGADSLQAYVQQNPSSHTQAVARGNNGIGNIYLATMLPNNSPLKPAVLAAWKKLFADGTYAKIMAKYGFTGEELPSPVVDAAAQ